MPTTATNTPRKQIPLSQQKLIWMYSAGQCPFLGCPIRTERPETPEDPAVIIGEVAHIHAYEDDGPRALLTMTLAERNSYSNLMLMCPNHHTEIDKMITGSLITHEGSPGKDLTVGHAQRAGQVDLYRRYPFLPWR